MHRFTLLSLLVFVALAGYLTMPKPKTGGLADENSTRHRSLKSQNTLEGSSASGMEVNARIVEPQPPVPGKDRTEVCADCHPDHVDGFKATGMGNSLYQLKDRELSEPWTREASTTYDPLTKATYSAFRSADGRYWQEEAIDHINYSKVVEAVYAIGSGNHTRSYLGFQNGELVELPLTYYFDGDRWDLSPGYEKNSQRFGRPVIAKCLFCHNDTSPLMEYTDASYQSPLAQGISCERCHGDGSAHVSSRLEGFSPPEGKPDTTILNPKHLTNYRQQQICEQCHLQGQSRRLSEGNTWENYDPRLPLHEYMTIYVENGNTDEFGIASHGARLQQSKCYQSEKLRCTTCHDPHAKSSREKYVATCNQCHTDGCGVTKNHNGYCPECHMPKGATSDIPHVQFSDHRIRIVSDTDEGSKTELQLEDPHKDLRSLGVDEDNLRLAIAYFDKYELEPPSDKNELARQFVDEHLLSLAPEFPSDFNVMDTVASFHVNNGSHGEAATTLETLLNLRPNDNNIRLRLARSLALNGERTRAIELIRKTPKELKFQRRYGRALASLKTDLPADLITELKYFTQSHPALEDATLALATKYLESQAFGQAALLLDQSLRNDPLQHKVSFLAATLAFDNRDYSKAIRLLSLILSYQPEVDAARWLRARSYLKQNMHAKALSDLKQASLNQPQNLSIQFDYLSVLKSSNEDMQLSTELKRLSKTIPPHLFQQLTRKLGVSL